MTGRTRLIALAGLAAIVACASAPGWAQVTSAPVPLGPPGTLDVRFFYEAPTTIDPTYHTAIWLEDDKGKLVRTLYVSQELSDKEYKMGNVCPDWVAQANWGEAPKGEVAAVTAPTPTVGMGELRFDLAKLGIAPGTYAFRFQMHVSEDYNVLYRGPVNVGGPAGVVMLEVVTGPGKPVTTDLFIKDVEVHYLTAAK